MSKKDEALKLALDLIEYLESEEGLYFTAEADAIREALADSALDRMAENERELGIQMQPAQQEEKPTTREEILSMAREAGIHVYPEFEGAFELFAALVAAHVREAEREACAKVCDDMDHNGVMIAADCADAIRARGQA